MQTIDKQRLIEWAEKNKSVANLISYHNLLSFIKQETSESDVLQDGDYFIGTKEEYDEIIRLSKAGLTSILHFEEDAENTGLSFFNNRIYHNVSNRIGSNELHPSEFFRKARNTFRNA